MIDYIEAVGLETCYNTTSISPHYEVVKKTAEMKCEVYHLRFGGTTVTGGTGRNKCRIKHILLRRSLKGH